MLVDAEDASRLVEAMGVPAEICFCRPSHVAMCLGYLGNDELTRTRFLPNPHGPGTLYRTGDLGHWEAPGEHVVLGTPLRTPGVLVVEGRNDDQIKVNGQMVNLVHVDAEALALDAVADAGSMAATRPDGSLAVVLYVSLAAEAAGKDGAAAAVREALKAHSSLPGYALPAFVFALPHGGVEKVPRNANGKLMRRQLPALDFEALPGGEDFGDDARGQVLSVLQKVLWRSDIDERSDIAALGVDSMLAIRLGSALRERSGVHVSAPRLLTEVRPAPPPHPRSRSIAPGSRPARSAAVRVLARALPPVPVAFALLLLLLLRLLCVLCVLRTSSHAAAAVVLVILVCACCASSSQASLVADLIALVDKAGPSFVPGLPRVVTLIELGQALLSYQDYHVLLR